MSTFLTIFSAPKPFTNPHIANIQRNAIQSWKELGEEVEIVLLGDEPGIAEAAKEFDVKLIPQVARNKNGTPLISSMFDLSRNLNESPLLVIINTDIILFPDFLENAHTVVKMAPKFLMVGQRYDLAVPDALDFSSGWQERLKERVRLNGKLHPRGGSDYFIFPRACFQKVPEFAIGRAGWDNWMIYEARRNHWKVIDCTKAIQIIHQDHDYAHLPGGQSHYRLPETNENIRLAGGPRTIFNLTDIELELSSKQLHPPVFSWPKFWREIEIFPLVAVHSRFLANVFFAVFHPQKAYWELRTWLKNTFFKH